MRCWVFFLFGKLVNRFRVVIYWSGVEILFLEFLIVLIVIVVIVLMLILWFVMVNLFVVILFFLKM